MIKFPADGRYVRTIGRSVFYNNIRYLSWSCSAVEFIFTGTSAAVELWTDWVRDEPWKEIFQPQMAVFVNDEKEPRTRFSVSAGTKSYTVFESGVPQTVKIRIAKLSEAAFSKIGIVSISADGEPRPAEARKIKMEFIGDSITCGFGIEGKSAGESFRTKTENPFRTYGALTGEIFGADYNFISWTGIGVYSSDCSPDAEHPADGWVMPMLYGFTDISAEDMLGLDHTPWDFESFVPDVIVVNLGTNDSIFVKNIPERTENFKKAYAGFLRQIREKNPGAYIICALGMMGDALGGNLFPVVAEAVSETGDGKIFSLEFDEQKESDGIGCEKHPNTVTHRKAAEKLIKKILEVTDLKIAGNQSAL